MNRNPQPICASRSSVSSFAEKTARLFMHDPCKKNIWKVLDDLGGRIEHRDDFDVQAATLDIQAPGRFSVVISNLCDEGRNRVAAAHELGHYLLHYIGQNRTDHMVAAYSGEDRAEWEANWFAGSFLMPEEAFCNAFNIYKGSTSLISSRFRVSNSAVESRVKALGLKRRIWRSN